MESLAVKHRPRCLEDLVGQDQVVDVVRGMLRHNVSQTLLVTGPYGAGKTTTARLIGRYLNCMQRAASAPPCGECVPCRNPSIDYQEINAANARGIEEIRGLIQHAAFTPQSNYRIFVLDEAHQLTPQAVQALLKFAEEPPPLTVLILCTTDPQKFPRALSSRCVKLRLDLVDVDGIMEILRRVCSAEELRLDDDVLRAIALTADGHPRDAIATLEGVVSALRCHDVQDVTALAQQVAEEVVGQSPTRVAAQYLSAVYRGRFTDAIMASRAVQNPAAFCDVLLSFHAHTLYYRMSRKLQEPAFDDWYGRLADLFPDRTVLDHRALVDVMEVLLRLQQDLKAYAIDQHYGLLNATVRAVDRFHAAHNVKPRHGDA